MNLLIRMQGESITLECNVVVKQIAVVHLVCTKELS